MEKAISAFLPKREPITPIYDATDERYKNRWSRPGDIAAHEDLPPLLYHVTTNLPAVLASGYLRPSNRADQGGLGAVPTDEPHISFTKNYRDAHNMLLELKRLGQIARGERDHTHFDAWRADDEKRAGLPEGRLKDALDQALFDYPIPDSSGKLSGPAPEWYRKRTTPERNFDTYKAYLSYRYADKGPTDPVFIGEAKDYERVLPHRLGIIAVRPSSFPEDYYAGGAVRHYAGDPNNEVRLYGSHLPLSEETRVVTPGAFSKSIILVNFDAEALEKAFYAQQVVDATGNPTGEYRFTTARNRNPVIQDAAPDIPKEAQGIVGLAKQHGLTLHGIASGRMMSRSTNMESGQTSLRPIGASVLTHTYSGTPGQWQGLRAALRDTTGDIGETPEAVQEARRGGAYNPTATAPDGGFTYLDPKTYTLHRFVPQGAMPQPKPKRPWSEHDAWLKEQMQALRRPSERLPQQRGVTPQGVEANPLARPIPQVTPEGRFVTDTGRDRVMPTLERDPLGVPVPVEVPEAASLPPEAEGSSAAPIVLNGAKRAAKSTEYARAVAMYRRSKDMRVFQNFPNLTDEEVQKIITSG